MIYEYRWERDGETGSRSGWETAYTTRQVSVEQTDWLAYWSMLISCIPITGLSVSQESSGIWMIQIAWIIDYNDDRILGVTWWHIGWGDTFQPEGRGFESRSRSHVRTLGKYLTCICLWRFGVKLRHSINDWMNEWEGEIHQMRGWNSLCLCIMTVQHIFYCFPVN